MTYDDVCPPATLNDYPVLAWIPVRGRTDGEAVAVCRRTEPETEPAPFCAWFVRPGGRVFDGVYDLLDVQAAVEVALSMARWRP